MPGQHQGISVVPACKVVGLLCTASSLTAQDDCHFVMAFKQHILRESMLACLLQEAAGSGMGGDGAARLAAAVVAAEEQLARAKGQVARLHTQSVRLWDTLPREVCPSTLLHSGIFSGFL